MAGMTSPSTKLRLAEIHDASQISSLLHESFTEFRSLYTDEGFAATVLTSDEVLKRMREGNTWVAVRDDKLIGTISTVGRDDSLYIRGMAVLPVARGAGAGGLLLEEVEKFAVERGYKRLFLSTTPFLSAAIRLYEHFGFQRIAAGPHDLFGTPLFTMEKFLRS